MRRIFVIGIGAGDPDHVTVQAIKALNAVDVFFVVDKGSDKHDLMRLRQEICERHVERRGYRTVEIADPERDRGAPAYRSAVETWRRQRAERWEQAIREELDEGGSGAFLAWGDPSLYDSTLAVIEHIAATGALEFEYEVIPGISSVQALAARHRIPLNRVGGQLRITTGRRLRAALAGTGEGHQDIGEDVVVMLDPECSFKALVGEDIDIYWGGYLGTEDEVIVAGKLSEVAGEIEHVREQARRRKGWIMDTYLLRRRERDRD